ncbi:class I SAM-dependent methyltransferase [bacterium]|nr:class I SAM-dependent methyltransferase [bacterium]
MARIIRFLAAIAILFTPPAVGFAQEKSVKPGVNDPFKNPDIAEWVTKFEGESRETYQKRQEIVAACKLKLGMIVADVGAGTGLYTRLFAEAVGKDGTVNAVDISPKFLEHIEASAKKLGVTNVKTVLGTDYSVELPDASADLVFICDTYHHFEYPARMMHSIHKVLKSGGRVVLIDFIRVPGKSSEWVMGHVRAGQELVEKEIVECGFHKTSEIKDLLQENYIVVFEKASNSQPRDQ